MPATIDWPEETKSEDGAKRRFWPWGPYMMSVLPYDQAERAPGLSPRNVRDVAVILAFVAIVVVLFVLLWLGSPLPRLFPSVSPFLNPVPHA